MLKASLKVALGVLFIVAGCGHFAVPGPYVKIMPPVLPWPLALVYLSGLCEVGLGALMFTRFALFIAWAYWYT